MSLYANLVAATPTGGILTGDGTDMWVVEMALPPAGVGVLGSMTLNGTFILAEETWTDVTDHVVQVDIDRGGPVTSGIEQPETGVAEIRMWMTDSSLHPLASLYNGPGTYVRVSYRRSGVWQSLFFGITESWQTLPTLNDGMFGVVVRCAEAATFRLAGINNNATGLQGDGETAEERLTRLVPSDFIIGVTLDAPFDTMTMQSTDLSANRLAEVKQLAQSVNAIVHTRGNGTLRMVGRNGMSGVTHTIDDNSIQAGSLVAVADATLVTGVLKLARKNGTEYVWNNTGVNEAFTETTSGFSAFLNDDDADLDALAQPWLTRARVTKRPVAVTINKDYGTDARNIIFYADLGDLCTVDDGYAQYQNYPISRIHHTIKPRVEDKACEWSCTISFGVDETSNASFS